MQSCKRFWRMRVRRAVLDTNILISAALRPTGPPRQVIDVVLRENGELLFSDQTFDELQTRIWRPKFDSYISRNSRGIYLAQLKTVTAWVSIARAKMGCRDPDDDMFLETALIGDADCLITGDRDLLEMTPLQGTPILTPTEVLERLA